VAKKRRVPKGVKAYARPIGPRTPADQQKYDERKAAKMAALRSARGGKAAGKVGLGALAALGTVGAGVGATKAAFRMVGADDETLMRKAMEELVASQREGQLQQERNMAMRNSLEQSIDMNLRKLQAAAPDLYASVAAGRRLPQGAVVLGGAPRQDLLNELGRAMADGRFSR